MPWGVEVYAKINAINSYGSSATSDAGNGAIIYTVPDPPESLEDRPLITTSTQIGIQWQDAVENGGTDILDYEISYDQGTATYVVLAYGIIEQYYTAVGLTPGQTYKFKVSARNAFGQGSYSSEVSILAA